ncbi:MAG: tetratricopeptide repeat protein [Verrucomicrobiota bacterium]
MSLRSRVLPVWQGGLIVLLVFLAYLPALHGGFVWDDDSHISTNETLQSWQGLWAIWFRPGATCQYYPLSFTLFWLGYQLWGLNPLGYHLLNVALHSLVAVLLWQILERLKVRGAWLAGAIFALHPVCVMSVAWMTELKNTLSAALALGAGWAYVRFAGLGVYGAAAANDDNPGPSASGTDWRYGVLALALFLLAMFAKTAVSFLPVTLLLVAWWQQERLVWRKVVPLLLMLVLVAVMGEVTFYIERLYGAVGTGFKLDWLERVLVSGRSFWFYLGKLFFPYPLTFIYERWNINYAAGWQYLYPAATVGLFAALWWTRRVIGKGPFAAMLHFYISTSLLILVVVLYMTQYSFVSDHWQYFGCMSVLALAAAGITRVLDWLEKWNRFLKPVLVGTLLLVLGLLTWRQAGMYTDLETLWRTTLARNPDCLMAHYNLGNLLSNQGRIEEAMEHYHKALQINPNFSKALYNLGMALAAKGRFDEAIKNFYRAIQINPNYPEALNNLGNALAAQGRFDEAIAYYRKAIQIKPNYCEAQYNLGNALAAQGRFDEAIAYYRKAIQIKPYFSEALDNLGNALAAQGRFDEAIENYRQAIQLNSNHPEIFFHLGMAFDQLGRTREAVAQYREALRLNPNLTGALNNLAWVLAASPDDELRNGPEAVRLAERACELTHYGAPFFIGTLAAAYAESGRFPEAVTTAEKAEQLATSAGLTAMAAKNRQLLEFYRAGKPYHELTPTRQ